MSNICSESRLRLRSFDARNLGERTRKPGSTPESLIREGYTEAEIHSGIRVVTPEEALEHWRPANPKSVALALNLSIGWDNGVGADNFTVYIITNAIRDQINIDPHPVISVEDFKWPDLLKSILDILRKCEGNSWKESVRELCKRFEWEYSGMAEYESWLRSDG
ncbi:Imm8 family immunity protein [Mesorhizobium ciceri]|uniref:Imm8 family immunity protein n=1 Tax=Mesorhizobium TaxID=68287 RepID=UPI0009DEF054|nr:Imm8 family immunity protein [Mesorhizobium ciceri]